MDIDPQRLSAALQDIYAATLEPTDRPLLPHKMAAAFDAHSCLMHTRDEGPPGVTIIGGTQNCTSFLPDYVAYYHAQDAWTERGSRRSNGAFFGEDVVGAGELLAAEWYNDLLRWHEIHHLVGAVFELEAGAIAAVGVHRPVDAAGFETRDRAMLDLLLPHLKQALRLIRRVDAGERARRLSFDALTALSVGVFVVSAEAQVRLMNAAAERLVRAGAAVRLRNSRVSIAGATLDERLRAAIRRASLAPLGRSLCAGEQIVVPTEEGSVTLMVVPLPPELADGSPAEPLAAVFAGEATTAVAPSPQLAQATYGLTPAETRLLCALLTGQRLGEYAVNAGISTNTVNAQIKSVFAKTGCHRQAELIRKIMSDPLLRLAQKPGK